MGRMPGRCVVNAVGSELDVKSVGGIAKSAILRACCWVSVADLQGQGTRRLSVKPLISSFYTLMGGGQRKQWK